MAKILILETNQGHPASELPEDLEYSSCVAKEIAPALRSLGHEVIEILKPTPADAVNAIDTYDPDVIWHTGHGQVCITTLENQGTWMTHKSDSYDACIVDRYLQYAPNRFFSMLSCLAGSGLGPRLVREGATAFMGYDDSFWFLVCNEGGTACPCGRGLSDPEEIRGMKCSTQCDLEWLRALAEGKTVKEAYDSSQARFQSEIEYWEASSHDMATDVLYCLRLDKERQVALGDMNAKIIELTLTPTPTPAPTITPTPTATATAPPVGGIIKCLFPRMYNGTPTPRISWKELTPRLNCVERVINQSKIGIKSNHDITKNSNQRYSVIIPVHELEEEENVKQTIESLEATSALPHDIFLTGIYNHNLANIRHNPDTKIIYLKVSMPRGDARNFGANYAIQHYNAQYVCFCDANLIFPHKRAHHWDKILIDYLEKDDKAIVSPTMHAADRPKMNLLNVLVDPEESPELKPRNVSYPPDNTPVQEAPALCGCFQFMTAQTFKDSIFGQLPGLPIEDYEFCLRMWTLGHHSVVIPSVSVGHIYRSRYIGWQGAEGPKTAEEYCITKLLFGIINFDWNVVQKIYDKLTVCPDKAKVYEIATSQKWLQYREEVQRKRIHTTEEYYKKFKGKTQYII